MTPTSESLPVDRPTTKTRVEVFVEDLIVDVVITVAIVLGLVLLGEPLRHVLTSPLFIVLTAVGLIHLVVKTVRHDPGRR